MWERKRPRILIAAYRGNIQSKTSFTKSAPFPAPEAAAVPRPKIAALS
jgi:hypothetical protein